MSELKPNGPSGSLQDLLVSVRGDGKKVAASLLGQQYLPNVRSDGDELPPMFSTEKFTRELAKEINDLGDKRPRDYLRFRFRRFDGLLRGMGLPHPVPYARLISHIEDNWRQLRGKLTSGNSMIKPTLFGDGRVIQMSYEPWPGKDAAQTRMALGKEYRVEVDIANCFPSIYSHAIDWSLRGYDLAKRAKNNNGWEVELDKFTRNCHFGETAGLMIGPAVSNVLAEAVLQSVDDRMRQRGFGSFVRYIDDVIYFSKSREGAENFIAAFDAALAEFRLRINPKKTRIVSLREEASGDWRYGLKLQMPKRKRGEMWADFLRHAEDLSKVNPGASILAFSVKVALSRLGVPGLKEKRVRDPRKSDFFVLEEVMRLSYLYPHLTRYLVRYLRFMSEALRGDKSRCSGYAEILREILRDACKRRETDTGLWAIYGLRRLLREGLSKKDVERVLDLDDDLMSLGVSIYSKKAASLFSDRVSEMDVEAPDTLDNHWLSRYELFRVGRLEVEQVHEERERPWFDVCLKHDLSFSLLKK